AGDGRVFIERPAEARLAEREALRGFEVGGDPVLDSVAYEVAERIRRRDGPQVAVVQHVAEEDRAKPEDALLGVGVTGRIVVAVLLDRRQAARLRRVLQQEIHPDRNARGNQRIEIELRMPVVKQQYA